MTEPVDISETVLGTATLTPRFAISEQHGDQAQKVRLIVDFRAPAINSIVETNDTCIPDTLGAFVAIASYLALVAPGCDLMCVAADFAHAYKHIPILDSQREFATILIEPPPPQGALKVS